MQRACAGRQARKAKCRRGREQSDHTRLRRRLSHSRNRLRLLRWRSCWLPAVALLLQVPGSPFPPCLYFLCSCVCLENCILSGAVQESSAAAQVGPKPLSGQTLTVSTHCSGHCPAVPTFPQTDSVSHSVEFMRPWNAIFVVATTFTQHNRGGLRRSAGGASALPPLCASRPAAAPRPPLLASRPAATPRPPLAAATAAAAAAPPAPTLS